MLKPSRLSIIALSSVALVLPGCGGSSSKGVSKADYEKQVKKLGEQFRSQVTATQGKVTTATTTDARLKALEEFKAEFSSFADKIDKITPPSGAQDEQDSVVASFKKGAGDIGKVEDAVRSKDQSKIQSAAKTFQTDATSVQTDLQKLRNAVTGK